MSDKPFSVKEIMRQYLVEHKYDGLYLWGECACICDDLMPCGEYSGICEPGYIVDCDCGDHDYHIGPEKKEGKGT